MSQQIATIIAGIVIIGLIVLDRDSEARTSKAIWIPLIYVLIIGSRPVSMWLGDSPDAVTDAVNGVYSSPIDSAVSLALLALGAVTLIVRRKKVVLLAREADR